MNDDRLKEEMQLFTEALEIESSRLDEWLDERCAGDDALRERIKSLLAGHHRAGKSATSAMVEPLKVRATDPQQIGPYKVIGRLGEGGMGVVYAAEQTEPVRRRVALKLVRTGAESREVLVRFEAERQALALMNHPCIAQILDAGEHDGRPYFVMEHISGLPITEYCDHRRLPVRERLDLFVDICRGVHHAHQKGVIHRDLKPSNVLVTESTQEPMPKIIDFGIAKAVSAKLTDSTLHTEFGRIIGTPDYMSPEQADITPLDIDTRSDVYSLGVLLYELLTGSTPFGLVDRKANLDEIRSVLLNERPARPSTRLTDGHVTKSRAAARSTSPEELTRALRNDLDWIVLRAMDSDRVRRYPSASELANDISRYLSGDPVIARPPSASYKISKFVRRRRVEIVVATMFMVLLLTLGIGGTIVAVRESRASARLQTELARSEALGAFARNIFQNIDPALAKGSDTTFLRELMAETEQRIDVELADEPEAAADMWFTVGSAYYQIGEYDKALSALGRARSLSEEIGSVTRRESSDQAIAASLVALTRLDEAATLFRELLDARSARLGPGDPKTLDAEHGLASVLMRSGELERAKDLAEHVADGRHSALGPEDPNTLSSLNTLAMIEARLDNHERAAEIMRDVIAGELEALGPEHPNTLSSRSNLALSLSALGDHTGAVEQLESVTEARRRILPPGHPSLIGSFVNLAHAYSKVPDLEAAGATLIEANQAWALHNEEPDFLYGAIQNMTGEVARDQGRHDDAAAAFGVAYVTFESLLGPAHATTQRMGRRQAEQLLELGDHAEASEIAAALLSVDLDPNDPRSIRASIVAFNAMAAGGDPAAARAGLTDLKVAAIAAEVDQQLIALINAALEGISQDP